MGGLVGSIRDSRDSTAFQQAASKQRSPCGAPPPPPSYTHKRTLQQRHEVVAESVGPDRTHKHCVGAQAGYPRRHVGGRAPGVGGPAMWRQFDFIGRGVADAAGKQDTMTSLTHQEFTSSLVFPSWSARQSAPGCGGKAQRGGGPAAAAGGGGWRIEWRTRGSNLTVQSFSQ